MNGTTIRAQAYYKSRPRCHITIRADARCLMLVYLDVAPEHAGLIYIAPLVCSTSERNGLTRNGVTAS